MSDTETPTSSFTGIRNSASAETVRRNPEVMASVVDALASSVISERVELVRKALTTYDSISKAASSIRPRPSGVDADGNPLAPTYSNEDYKRLTTLRTALTDLDGALARAASDAEYEPLTKTLNRVSNLLSNPNTKTGDASAA